ncbi:MAG: PorT family protein [Gammaproteobacteria bacterium]|nr:PorT family protein [Gammaproteobacteria bacterium]MYC53559.1 PorT family protein [Gammaproteobacteria bacterium]
MKRLSLVLIAALFALASRSPAAAQATLSLTGGVNLSTLAADAPSAGDIWHSESLARMSIGVAATLPVTKHVGVQLGVAYAQKGGRLSGLDNRQLVTVDMALDYFEFTLLAVPTLSLPSWERSSVRFFVGPTLASRVSCDFDASGWFGAEHVAAADSCDAGQDEIEAAMDLGVALGGGIAVGVTDRADVSVDLLYTLGLIPIGGADRYASGPRHRVLTLRAGMAVPIG